MEHRSRGRLTARLPLIVWFAKAMELNHHRPPHRRTLEERLRIEAEMILSMFMRRDKHTVGADAFSPETA